MKCRFNHVKVAGVTAVVPENVINIDDEIEFYHGDKKLLERNKKILGLGTRYVADENTTNADLCECAANNLLEENKIDKKSIDALILVTTSPDYVYPATSCILQDRLGLEEDCTCFDMTGLGCSGYVHGLLMAHTLVESGVAKRCLLLVGDIASKHSDKRNRNVNMLFGDAATATLVEYTEEENSSYFHTGTRGSGWKKIIAPAGGFALPIRKDIAEIEVTDEDGNAWHMWEDIMKGFDVFKFTMEIAPQSISELLDFSQKTIEDIDFFAFHQANGQIVKNISKMANIPQDKTSAETFRKYANCSTASVISVLTDQLYNRKVNDIMLVTFGIGLSWGSCIINFDGVMNGGIKKYKPIRTSLTREEKIDYWLKYNNGDIE